MTEKQKIAKMATSTAKTTLSLYKKLIRESEKFSSYNFRMYALRRVKDAFKENKTLSDGKLIKDQMAYGKQNLEIIKRQVLVGNLYSTEKLVIETDSGKMSRTH